MDHRADIYALGVVLYQMLTGELPGKPIEPPSKKVHVDVRLDEVVLRALEKKPELRYQQVSEVKTYVETIAAGGQKSEVTTHPPQIQPGYFVAAKLAAIIVAVLIFGYFAFAALVQSNSRLYSATAFVTVTTPAGNEIPSGKYLTADLETLAKSPQVMDTVISNLNLTAVFTAERHTTRLSVPETRQQLSARTFVWQIPHTDSYQLTVAENSPGEAVAIAQEIARQLTAVTKINALPGGKIVELTEPASLNPDHTRANVLLNLTLGLVLGAGLGRIFYALLVMAIKLMAPGIKRSGDVTIPRDVSYGNHGWKWFGITVITLVVIAGCFLVITNTVLKHKMALAQQERAAAAKKFGPVIPYAPLANPEFGPVIEVTLPLHEKGYSDTLDADSGQIIPTPQMQAAWDWGTSYLPNGIIVLPQTSAYPTTLAGTSTTVWPLPGATHNNWDEPTALHDAAAGNASIILGATVSASSEGDLPRTFAFQTPRGKRGLLQVVGLTENPPGVEIRYKLVQSGTEETNVISSANTELANLIKNPQTRELLRTQQKTLIDQIYSALAVPTNKYVALKELLLDRQVAMTEPSLAAMNGTAAERAAATTNVLTIKASYDGKIKDLLGAQDYQIFQDYEKSLPERLQVLSFQSTSPVDSKLTVDQENRLASAMYAERQAMPDLSALSKQAFGSSILNSNKMVELQAQMEELEQGYLRRAATILTPDQLERFKEWQEQAAAARAATVKQWFGNAPAPTNAAPSAMPPATPVTPYDPAVTSAETWLSGIDQGNYAESWQDAAPIFQKAVTAAAWENSMNNFRKPLGDLQSRQLISAQRVAQLPGVPDGQYVVMQFVTSFVNKQSAVETVTVGPLQDGKWKASGYFIK